MKSSVFAFVAGMLLFTATSFAQSKEHYDKKPYIEGEMLVQILEEVNLYDMVKTAPAAYDMYVAKELSRPMRVWLVKFDESVDASAVQYWFYNQPGVTVADYNYHVEMRSTLPGDPNLTNQWHHVNNGGGGATADADIDSDLAWDLTQGGQTATNDDIVVCMVEGSGGNLDHQDLAPNRWTNQGEIPNNNQDDDNNGYIDDYEGWNTGSNNDNTGTGGHGTSCLGMIGAKGDNGLNVVGANWNVKLMVVNMSGGLSQSNVIEAYTYPLVLRQQWNNSGGTEGAFVVATSASWGIDGANPNNYPLWCQFYDTLGRYGILNVGATTNQNLDVDTAGDMPTACSSDYMIGVGRTDDNDNTAGGYGDQTINFGAPGIDVVTTSGSTGITTTTGTSFACPLTAGVIGLAYSIPCNDFMELVVSDPQGAADAVLAALTDGVDPKSQLSTRFITGGRLNAKNTLDELIETTCNINVCNFDVIETVVEPPCAGTDNGSISVSVSGGAPGYTYDWGLNGGNVSSISSLGPGVYYVDINDNAGCDTLMEFNIDYAVDLDVQITGTNVSCPGAGDGMVVASASGSSGYMYQWTNGPASDTYSSLGAGSYTVTVTDALGCTATESVSITEPPAVSVGFTYNDNFLSVSFSNSSVGGPSSWDFGDGTTSFLYNPSHVYSTPGTYTVCLSILGACDTLTDCQQITVTQNTASLNEQILSDVDVYPNPTNGMLYFAINNEDLSTIEIVDMVGKVIIEKKVLSEITEIDLRDYANGTYFYRVKDASGQVVINDRAILNN